MHQASHVSVTLPDIALDIAAPPPSDQLLPEFARRQLPGDSPDLPFRPPIA